jgi:inhibitor of cysteine peptidase
MGRDLRMQREIKKKTLTYGITAVILVAVLAASIYNYGIEPDTILPTFSELKTFSSFEEFENFVSTNMQIANQNTYAWDALKNTRGESPAAMDVAEADGQGAPTTLTVSDYSATNIQVQGVDEADIVKTDGEYLYVVSESAIYILKAYPPNQARLLSKITLDQTYGAKIYVNNNKLVVLADQPFFGIREYANSQDWEDTESSNVENKTITPDDEPYDEPIDDAPVMPYIYIDEVFLKVYDITDKANPVLSRTVKLNGTLSGSRMIGDYVYMVTNQLATQPNYNKETGVDVILPVIAGDKVKEIEADEIHYINVTDQYYFLTTIIAVNTVNDGAEPTYEVFLTSQTTNLYVSLKNMYLITPDTSNWLLRSESAEESRQETLIYRVKLDKQKIVVEAEGSVPGFVLNQFSMDEYDGYFRIATTEWNSRWTDEIFSSESTNNLFILDMDLNIRGKLENIAPDESIYSTRFMGDKVYMVTFRQIDPFFVIDASDPTQPKILGYLKIPGYSSYLHPYDENHIIGVGMQDSALKLSLFDVTDFSAPKEIAKYMVEGGWSSSTALYDHKAFLFSKAKNLLALPVTLNVYRVFDGVEEPVVEPRETNGAIGDDEEANVTVGSAEVRVDTAEEKSEISYQSSYYQGAYVFDISTEQGFILKGNITHLDRENQYEYLLAINRIIYIEDAIYTISDKIVKINDLESLEAVTEIQLS